MKKLIWDYAMAVAEEQEAVEFMTPCSYALDRLEAAEGLAEAAWAAIARVLNTMAAPEPLANAIHTYAISFARERLAYRFGIGETAATNVARIKAQRELFAQLAK